MRKGWVEDWDDASRHFLVLFGETEPPYSPAPDDNSPFVLTDHAERRVGRVKLRAGQQQFRFKVLKRYGCKCAVCSITHPQLLVAAHICGKASAGSDDWRNGLPLIIPTMLLLTPGCLTWSRKLSGSWLRPVSPWPPSV